MPDRIYLDACVLNRPRDNQRISRNRLEAIALEAIPDLAAAGQVDWIASQALWLELAANPDRASRDDSLLLLSLCHQLAAPTAQAFTRAADLRRLSYGDMDALHLVLSGEVGADYLLTVDDRFISLASRREGSSRPSVINPIDWLRRRQPWHFKP